MIVDALAAPEDPALDELLGGDAAGRLRAALAARARAWASVVAPGRALEAATLADARAALGDHRGPVLFAAPDVPALSAHVARLALEDLALGCDLAVGVAHDARPYLVALPRVDSDLVELLEASFTGGVLTAFAERDLTLGMLRHERRLVSPADARALALDPLTPPDIAELVRGSLPGAPHR